MEAIREKRKINQKLQYVILQKNERFLVISQSPKIFHHVLRKLIKKKNRIKLVLALAIPESMPVNLAKNLYI